MSQQKFLVTGGAGYIGSHLVSFLLEKGHEVVVLDSLLYGDGGMEDWRHHARVKFIQGDICNIKDLVKAMEGVSTVVALAAIVGDPACALNPTETITTNFQSTRVLVDIARFMKIKRIVFASSCSVYGENSDSLLDETSALKPVSLYAKTRIMSENLLSQFNEDLEIVTLRLSTVFGLSRRMRYDLVVNTLSAFAHFENRIPLINKHQHRPLVHVQDAARAFMWAAEAPAENVAGNVFNVGSSTQNYSVEQVGALVGYAFPKAKIQFATNDDARDYRVNFEKIEKQGFSCKHTVERGITEIKEYFEENPALNYKNDVFYNVRYLDRNLLFTLPQPETSWEKDYYIDQQLVQPVT